MIEIGQCSKDEIKEVMSFIDRHWKKDHILSKNQKLIDWQHLESNDKYSFIIAKDNEEIIGILGYINTNRFDTNIVNITWLALWKVIEPNNTPGVGLRLLKKLAEQSVNSNIAVNGINNEVKVLYSALGYEVVDLKCFYILNPRKHNVISTIKSVGLKEVKFIDGNAEIDEVDTLQLRKLKDIINKDKTLNHKSILYFINKYLKNPYYNYRLFKISSSTHTVSLIATRVISYKNSKIMRIIDFSGDSSILAYIGKSIRRLLIKEDLEYIDFWQYGIDESLLKKSGFSLVNDQIIIPNLFEPFVNENGKIAAAFKLVEKNQPFYIFKADGDQDRPNAL